jgi:hypothetical protein
MEFMALGELSLWNIHACLISSHSISAEYNDCYHKFLRHHLYLFPFELHMLGPTQLVTEI